MLTLNLGRMTQDVRKYCDMMGEMGAGIIHEEDIDMECNNSLTQSWGTYFQPIEHPSFDKKPQLQSKTNVPGSSS